MAKKSQGRSLQRLTRDETGKTPKLMFCLRLTQQHARADGETSELWLSRLFLAHRAELEASARDRDEDRGEP